VIDTALVRQITARVFRDVVPDAYDEHDRAIDAVLEHMEVCEAPEPCLICERLVEAADAAFGRLQAVAAGRGAERAVGRGDGALLGRHLDGQRLPWP
jgi:hypothetical protein